MQQELKTHQILLQLELPQGVALSACMRQLSCPLLSMVDMST